MELFKLYEKLLAAISTKFSTSVRGALRVLLMALFRFIGNLIQVITDNVSTLFPSLGIKTLPSLYRLKTSLRTPPASHLTS